MRSELARVSARFVAPELSARQASGDRDQVGAPLTEPAVSAARIAGDAQRDEVPRRVVAAGALRSHVVERERLGRPAREARAAVARVDGQLRAWRASRSNNDGAS